jgi:hypothetical protein
MSSTSVRIARVLAAGAAALACAMAPPAAADPSDLLPECSGDESPANDNCGTPCPENAPVRSDGTCAEPGTQEITGGPADDLNYGMSAE